jgi:hypothetical protein
MYNRTLPVAGKVKKLSLASANDIKTGEQRVFSEIHTNYEFRTPQGIL